VTKATTSSYRESRICPKSKDAASVLPSWKTSSDASGAQHALALARHSDRVIEEEEDDEHRDSGERLVGQR
jgi:hypothetical protein